MAKYENSAGKTRIPVVDLRITVPKRLVDDLRLITKSGLIGATLNEVVTCSISKGIATNLQQARDILENSAALGRLVQKRNKKRKKR